MTIKEFAKKYQIPLNRVKAAMEIPQRGPKAEELMGTEYNENDLVGGMYCSLLEDMRVCIERGAEDSRICRRLTQIMAKEDQA